MVWGNFCSLIVLLLFTSLTYWDQCVVFKLLLLAEISCCSLHSIHYRNIMVNTMYCLTSVTPIYSPLAWLVHRHACMRSEVSPIKELERTSSLVQSGFTSLPMFFTILNPHNRAPWCWAGCVSCQSNTCELLATTWLRKQLSSGKVLPHHYSWRWTLLQITQLHVHIDVKMLFVFMNGNCGFSRQWFAVSL